MTRRAAFAIPNRDPARPRARDVALQIAAFLVQPGNLAGGILHCQIADGNINAQFWRSGIDDAIAANDSAAQDICAAMLAMTPTQRRRALARTRSLPQSVSPK